MAQYEEYELDVVRTGLSATNILLITTISLLVPWLVLVFVVLFQGQWQGGHYFANQLQEGINIIDFLQFYSAGQQIYTGNAYRIYDVRAQLQCMNMLIQPLISSKCFVMQYVPTLLPFLTVLASVPLALAYFFWTGISVGAGLSILFVICRQEGFSVKQVLLCLFLVFASFPSIFAIRLGQSAWFLFAFSLLYFFFLKHNRPYWGGIMLTLTTIKPQYAVILAAPALAGKKWKLLVTACLCEFLLLVIAVSVLGINNILSFPSFVSDAETNPIYWGVFPQKMICIRSLISNHFSEIMVLRVCMLLWLAAAAATFAYWQKLYKQRPDNHKFWLFSSITTLIAVVFSPHSHAYDLLLCAGPFAMLAKLWAADDPGAGKRLSWTDKLALLLLLSFSLTSYWLYMLPEQYHALLLFLLMLLLLLGKSAFHTLNGKLSSDK